MYVYPYLVLYTACLYIHACIDIWIRWETLMLETHMHARTHTRTHTHTHTHTHIALERIRTSQTPNLKPVCPLCKGLHQSLPKSVLTLQMCPLKAQDNIVQNTPWPTYPKRQLIQHLKSQGVGATYFSKPPWQPCLQEVCSGGCGARL